MHHDAPIETEQSNLTERLEAGDHLVIYEKSGRIADMTLTLIDGDSLKGTLAGNNFIPVEVDINDIEKIEVEKIDGVKTTLAVVGGAIVIMPLAMIAAVGLMLPPLALAWHLQNNELRTGLSQSHG